MATMMITDKKCPECGDLIAPAKDVAQYNRNLAMHKRAKHGYKSPHYQQAKGYKARLKLNQNGPVHWTQRPGSASKMAAAQRLAWKHRRQAVVSPQPAYTDMSPQAVARRAYQKRWRDAHPTGKRSKQQQQASSEVVSCNLAACPACGARFYIAKGNP